MLKKFVALYVTSTRNGGEPISTNEHLALVDRVARVFCEKFGGASTKPATGYWLSDTKGVIAESVTIVESFHNLDTREALAIVIPLAESIKAEFNQEAVSIQTEEGLQFV